jgi:hypothetical protein
MSGYIFDNFLCNIYSDELIIVDPDEIDEVQRLMAEDNDWLAYAEWANQLEETERAAALEQFAFERKQERLGIDNVNGSPIFINRDCSHKECRSSRCSRELRLGGIAL